MGKVGESFIWKIERCMNENLKLELLNDVLDFLMVVYMSEKLNNENVAENELWDIRMEYPIHDDLKIINIMENELCIAINLILNELLRIEKLLNEKRFDWMMFLIDMKCFEKDLK